MEVHGDVSQRSVRVQFTSRRSREGIIQIIMDVCTLGKRVLSSELKLCYIQQEQDNDLSRDSLMPQ